MVENHKIKVVEETYVDTNFYESIISMFTVLLVAGALYIPFNSLNYFFYCSSIIVCMFILLLFIEFKVKTRKKYFINGKEIRVLD